jgi:hypothetical protein
MSLFEDNSREALIEIANKVNDVGYESLLLVYDSFLENAIVNVSNTINKEHKFKYIIAIRTYAVSPEFLINVYQSFEKLAPGRVTFNIIPGNIKFHETSLNDVVFIEDKIRSSEQRDLYTLEWLKKYNRLSVRKNLPPVMLSGHTADFQKACIDYGLTNIIQLGDFLDQKDKTLIENKNQIISAAIVIKGENGGDSKTLLQMVDAHKSYTMYGDKDRLKDMISNLKSMGVSDMLIHSLSVGHKSSEIHKFIKTLLDSPIQEPKEMV